MSKMKKVLFSLVAKAAYSEAKMEADSDRKSVV